jgi:hypothetical protein
LAAYGQYFLLIVATKITLSTWLVALKIKGGNKLTFQKISFIQLYFWHKKTALFFTNNAVLYF